MVDEQYCSLTIPTADTEAADTDATDYNWHWCCWLSPGKEMDQDGNLVSWWSNASLAAYEERAQCFVDQYSQYPNPGDLHSDQMAALGGATINGKQTNGENIADSGGQ